MNLLNTVFDGPQWKWHKADGPQKYGTVDNSIVTRPITGPQRMAYTTVPTELFPVLEAAGFGPQVIEAKGAHFELCQVEGWWVLEFVAVDRGRLKLWSYTSNRVPEWMVKGALLKGQVQRIARRA